MAYATGGIVSTGTIAGSPFVFHTFLTSDIFTILGDGTRQVRFVAMGGGGGGGGDKNNAQDAGGGGGVPRRWRRVEA